MNDTRKPGGIKDVNVGFGGAGNPLPGLPLKILVVAEMTPRDLRTGQSAERRKRIRVDRQSFDEVMESFQLRAFLDVPDRLTGGKDPLIVELAFPNLKAFLPDSVATRIPATAELLKLRKSLEEVKSAKLSLQDVRRELDGLQSGSLVIEKVKRALASSPDAGPAPSSTAPTADDSSSPQGLDALLSMVESPEGVPLGRAADLERLDALVRQLVRSEKSGDKIDPRAADAAIAEIDAALSIQIDEVIHHPEFRRLEATWRGLRLLTDRTDFEHPIRIEVIATGRESLLPVYDELVQVPESQGVSDEPVSMVLVDQVFDNSPGDIEMLRALSERGASLSVPVLAAAGAGFLGLNRAGELAKKPALRETFTGPDYAKWHGLREYGPSRWLGLVFNRFLLRPAHGEEGRKARLFNYQEGLPDGDDLRLWGNPVWALGTLATRSFARIGWCTDIMGQRPAGMIEDLPVRLYDRPGAEQVSFPLETVISDAIERDLSDNSVMTLSAALNSDRAYLRFAPSAHKPGHYQDPTDRARAKLQSTLPFQMFVGRVINFAMRIESILVPGRGPEQIRTDYDKALRGLLASAGAVPADAVQVAVVPNEDDATRQDLKLRVRWPGFQSLPGAGDMELRWPLMGI